MEKINKLRNLISKYQIDGYLIPKNDEFFNEYVSQNYDRLRFISSFSGSFGFALILKKKNYLFVDGRYTLQAKIQSGKFFEIITIPSKYPYDILKTKKLKIGFDPKLFTKKTLGFFFQKTECEKVPINQNLIDKLWQRNTNTKIKKFYSLPNKAFSQSYVKKLNKLVKVLNRKKANYQFVTASENIAWLLNIRGEDTKYTPMPNAYLLLDNKRKINLFCDLRKIEKSFKKKFNGINFIDIKKTNLFLLDIKNKKILIDDSTCSVYFQNLLQKNNQILKLVDPIYFLKAIKSKKEMQNIINSHIHDGVALTKFLFWIKDNFEKKFIDEIYAQEKLLEFRKQNTNFKFLSFPTISGSGPNGAIIHYKATEKSSRQLKKGDIYLVDSGGQYSFGTTDVTRTISLKSKNARIKNIFTRVLKGHIAVARFNLKTNTTGAQVDVAARKFLKEVNLDYSHGTGHGVGYFLNVHEGPQAITKKNKTSFKEGMIFSNEPGYYEKGKFGIRIENHIKGKKIRTNIAFEDLTMAPIDKELIDKNLLKKEEIHWLNNYHKKVFKNLKKFMSKIELLKLKEACSNI